MCVTAVCIKRERTSEQITEDCALFQQLNLHMTFDGSTLKDEAGVVNSLDFCGRMEG